MSSYQSKWCKILILDQNKAIQEEYQLDRKAKLLTKLKRQKRRNLGKMTGKKSLPKDWKKQIREFEEFSRQEAIQANSLQLQNTASSENENEVFQNEGQLTFDELVSIDWLLNGPPPIPAQ